MKKVYRSTMIMSLIIVMSILCISCTSTKTNTPPVVTQPPVINDGENQTPDPDPENNIPEEKADDVSAYFPMKVGNLWEYKGTGNEYAAYTQEVLYQKDNKYQIMISNGGTVMANVYEVSKDKIVNTYREAENYNNKNVLNKKTNLNIVMIQLPIKVGSKWTSEENNYEIMDINKKVIVPAGTFEDCIAVKEVFKEGSSYQIFYYKKDIGLIKSEFFTDQQDIISSELESYKINK